MSRDLYVRGVAPVARLLLMVIYLSLSSTCFPHPFFPVYVGILARLLDVKNMVCRSTLVSQTLFPAFIRQTKRVSVVLRMVCRYPLR